MIKERVARIIADGVIMNCSFIPGTGKKMQGWRNGNLIIEARKENFSGAAYTSARLVSKNKGDWKYGRIEIKAKLPAGKGMWPAIWMLPTNWEYGGWPNSGEIDIMENVGYLPDSVFGTVHTGAYNHTIGTQKVKSILTKKSLMHFMCMLWNGQQTKFLF